MPLNERQDLIFADQAHLDQHFAQLGLRLGLPRQGLVQLFGVIRSAPSSYWPSDALASAVRGAGGASSATRRR